MNDNRFSLAEVFKLRSKAFSEISEHAFAIDALAAAIADLDVALQTALDERNIDDRQALIASARRLAALLGGDPA